VAWEFSHPRSALPRLLRIVIMPRSCSSRRATTGLTCRSPGRHGDGRHPARRGAPLAFHTVGRRVLPLAANALRPFERARIMATLNARCRVRVDVDQTNRQSDGVVLGCTRCRRRGIRTRVEILHPFQVPPARKVGEPGWL
jgi:hypothetical protein